jgi:hypothetical protein
VQAQVKGCITCRAWRARDMLIHSQLLL